MADAREKLDQQLTVLFTRTDMELIERTAAWLGTGRGAAARFLVRRGAANPPFTPTEGNDHE